MANNKTTNVNVGDKFIDGNGIVHTIIEIDDDKVIHSYKSGKRFVSDGYLYRNVFDMLLKDKILWIL